MRIQEANGLMPYLSKLAQELKLTNQYRTSWRSQWTNTCQKVLFVGTKVNGSKALKDTWWMFFHQHSASR